jgi:hypothetical protein
VSYFELWIAADKKAEQLVAENARLRQQLAGVEEERDLESVAIAAMVVLRRWKSDWDVSAMWSLRDRVDALPRPTSDRLFAVADALVAQSAVDRAKRVAEFDEWSAAQKAQTEALTTPLGDFQPPDAEPGTDGAGAQGEAQEDFWPERHASPHCACGTNAADESLIDPICRETRALAHWPPSPSDVIEQKTFGPSIHPAPADLPEWERRLLDSQPTVIGKCPTVRHTLTRPSLDEECTFDEGHSSPHSFELPSADPPWLGEAIEAASAVRYGEPTDDYTWSTVVGVAMRAALPLIAAGVLREAADAWQAEIGFETRVPRWLRERAARQVSSDG